LVLAYARLIAAVGVDDGGEVLDDEESGDQPVVEVEDGGVGGHMTDVGVRELKQRLSGIP
jgi:hypothetical protein